MRQITSFLGILLSLFLISSCHYMGKKACCAKKRAGKHYQHKDYKGKKSCCDKKNNGQRWDKGKKCCKGKKNRSKWGKKDKKPCCGKASVAGFSSIKDLNKGKITGSVFFEKAGKYEVKVTANVKGLAPNKKFGFHVHEFGTCENKGLLAGGHLNPWGAKHSGPQARDRHFGDLGNLESDTLGTAVYSVSVKGKLDQFMGRSVIIHAKEDDMKTQPTGNSGARIACGVIIASMPPVQEDTQEEKPSVMSEKVKTPVVKKSVPKKGAETVVKQAVSSKKAETQKASDVSSVQTKPAQTSPKK